MVAFMRPPRSLSRCTFYGRCLPAATRLEPRFSFSSSPSPRFSLSSSLCFSLSLFLSCSFSALRRFSRSAFFSLFKWRWRTLRNSKDIWSLQEYLRPVSRVLLHIYRVAISTFIFDCQCKCFLLG